MHTPTVIISDLHLGSRFCQIETLNRFLDRVPEDARLILNGDTLDAPDKPLNPDHQQILSRLVDRSGHAHVVWIFGNHDDEIHLDQSGAIEFCNDYTLDSQLFICHGHYFDNVMPYHGWFMFLFGILHRLRIKLGATPVHVARYAKKWPLCYNYLRKNVMMNAIEHCREINVAAITCGHVHYPEDVEKDGIRYLNTGAWTETPCHYLIVNGDDISFRRWRDNGEL